MINGKSVLVVAHGYSDRLNGYMIRVLKMARSFSNFGYKVEIIWFYPLKQLLQRHTHYIVDSEFKIHFVPLPRLVKFQQLFLDLYAIFFPFYLMFRKPAVVQAENSAAMAICIKAKVPVIFDLHGDLVAEQNPAILSHHDLAQTKEARNEHSLVNKAGLLISNSHNLVSVLEKRHSTWIPPHIVLPCATEIYKFQSKIVERAAVRKQFGLDGKLVLCYLGGLSPWQCIQETLELVASLKQILPNIFLLLITQDEIAPYFKHLSKIGRLGEDFLVLSLASDEVARILPASDVGLLLRSPSPINYAASPTKCGEYLSSGVPVLTTAHAGDAASIIEREEVGYVLDDLVITQNELLNLVNFMTNVQGNRENWANRSTCSACSNYDWNAYQDVYHESISRVLGLM